MDKLLVYHLNHDWILVRSTFRWHYLRNKHKPPQLRGRGLWSLRLVRPWYEPVYLFFRRAQTTMRPGIRKIVQRIILDERP